MPNNVLNDLYRQVIMDHYKYPRQKGLVNDSRYLSIKYSNPSCGDELVIQLLLDQEQLQEIKHDGKGCSICCASASMMSEALQGKSRAEALQIIQAFYQLVQGAPYPPNCLQGDALALEGVKNFPARIKCATLAWKAVEKGLTHEPE
jgi:nitrogen fixation NifU-like protein